MNAAIALPDNFQVEGLLPEGIGIPILGTYAVSAVMMALSVPQTSDVVQYMQSPEFRLFLAGAAAMAGTIGFHLDSRGSKYDHEARFITFARKPIVSLMSHACHEYTHHLLGKPDGWFRSMREGFTRGVERCIANTYADSEDNPAYLHDISEYDAAEQKSVYTWMCKKLGRPASQGLSSKGIELSEKIHLSLSGRPTKQALGNVLFSTYEAVHGKELYKQVINGTFSFA
ncbi:MAG: hypothetical protein ABH879_10245 [archaeon]